MAMMDVNKKIQAGINFFACRQRRCGGSYHLPITLVQLAKMRVFGPIVIDALFSCKHQYRLKLKG
jgi:hypothetical protein